MFGSLITALPTLYRSGKSVDFWAMKEHLDFLVQNGTDAVAVAGSTGEGELLSQHEKWALFQFCRDYLPSSIKVIATIGGANTDDIKQQIKQANHLAVDGYLSVVPFYVKPTQEGIYQHFAELAKVSQKPMIIYNVPSRVGVAVEGETVLRLSEEFSNIVGFKQASSDIKAIELIKQKRPSFLVYSGDDSRLKEVLDAKGNGIISVGSNVFGLWFKSAIEKHQKGIDAASEWEKIKELSQLLSLESNPIPLKFMLHEFNLGKNILRLPLTPLGTENQKTIHEWAKHNPVNKKTIKH